MPTPPGTISLTPASVPSAPGTIALSPASAPSAPGTITESPASVPSAPGAISLTPASAPASFAELTIAGTKGVTVGGTLSPDATGFLFQTGETSGRPYYTTNGAGVAPATGTQIICAYVIDHW